MTELARLRQERDDARADTGKAIAACLRRRKQTLAVLRALLDAFEEHHRHAAECGCERCEALYAARKELGR